MASWLYPGFFSSELIKKNINMFLLLFVWKQFEMAEALPNWKKPKTQQTTKQFSKSSIILRNV